MSVRINAPSHSLSLPPTGYTLQHDTARGCRKRRLEQQKYQIPQLYESKYINELHALYTHALYTMYTYVYTCIYTCTCISERSAVLSIRECYCCVLRILVYVTSSHEMQTSLRREHTHNVHILMRNEKEEASKQGQTNNKAKQHSTPKAVTFSKKNVRHCKTISYT